MSSNRGKRYDEGERINFKKVLAAIIAILVIIMFIIIVKNITTGARDVKNTTAINYYSAYAEGKWGILNTNGDIVIEPMYQEMLIVINKAKDVFLCVYDVNEETGEYKTKVINKNNEEIFTEYDKVEALENYDSNQNVWYEEDVLRVQKDGKYGIISIDGKEILATEYDDIQTLKGVQNSIVIKKDEQYGLINKSGTKIIDVSYKSIENIDEDYKHGYIVTSNEGKQGIITYTGTKSLECNYEKIIKSYNENYYGILEGGKQKLINASGETVLENGFDTIEQINSNGIVFKKDGKYGFMDLEGNIKIPAEHDELKEISLGYLRTKKDNKYGVIALEDGQEKLANTYSDLYYVEKAAIYVAEDENFTSYVMDSEFNIKITGILSEFNVESGYMKIRINDEYKYYNFKFEEKDIKEILSENTLFVSKKDGKYGYVDKEGKVVVDYIYDEALEQNKYGFAAVKKNDLWGSIDREGKTIIKPIYRLESNLIIDFLGEWHLGEDLNMNYYCKK